MFSSRLHWDLRPNPISEVLAQKRAAGDCILDLTESNPTQAGIEYPVGEIVEAFATPRMLRYEPNPMGMQAVREALCDDPDRVLLTASTSEAYAYLFKLLSDPGDEVLVPRPSYPLFEFLAGMELVCVVQYPLVYHGVWEIDFEALRTLVTPRTRAIVLVNPNNPTGSYLHNYELPRLVEICREHGLAIISDEVFSEYSLTEPQGRVTSLREVSDVLTFCLSGLSKIAGLPQMKLGWMIVNGPPDLRAAALTRLELIADTYLSVGTPVQAAALKLLEIGQRIKASITLRTRRNLAELQSRTSVLHVEGGWYATLHVARVRSEEEWVLGLLQKGVLVQPGFFYDFPTEAFLIVSLLPPPDVFDEAVGRIKECE
jgi:aspartate/methionine/tyrosine aminotransferase